MDRPPGPAMPPPPAASTSDASPSLTLASASNGSPIPISSPVPGPSSAGAGAGSEATPHSGAAGVGAATASGSVIAGRSNQTASGSGTSTGAGVGADGSASGGGAAPPLVDPDNDLSLQFQRLSAAMEARVRQLNEQQEQIKQAEAALSAATRRMTALAPRLRSDVISLNVGGTPLAASRRTLTLVPDSLLGTMFSGAWDDHLQRDESGRVFLDYDPSIFSLLINWLRAQDMGGPEAPLWELSVEPEREEQLLVLIDFLQMQRHVPCRFTETFIPSLTSPFVTLTGSSAWRSAGAAGDTVVAATSHCFFDVDVELLLEVIRFGAVSRAPTAASGRGGAGAHGGHGAAEDAPDPEDALPNSPLFVGVMARSQLAGLDQARKKCNATWQSTCHGWWTRAKRGCEVREGKSRLVQSQALWAEGDTLRVVLEAAKLPSRGARGPRLALTNTRTNDRLTLDVDSACMAGCEEQWVVVVGLAGRGDEVRIHSARRRGMKLHADAAEAAAAGTSGNGNVVGGDGAGEGKAGAGGAAAAAAAGGVPGGAGAGAVAGEHRGGRRRNRAREGGGGEGGGGEGAAGGR